MVMIVIATAAVVRTSPRRSQVFGDWMWLSKSMCAAKIMNLALSQLAQLRLPRTGGSL